MLVLFNQSTIPSAVLQPALPGVQDGHPRGELKAAFRGEEPFRVHGHKSRVRKVLLLAID